MVCHALDVFNSIPRRSIAVIPVKGLKFFLLFALSEVGFTAGFSQSNAEPIEQVVSSFEKSQTRASVHEIQVAVHFRPGGQELDRRQSDTQFKLRVETLESTSGCRGCDLRGADFDEADLSNADLVRADLTAVKLNYAIMTDVDLSRAVLFGATLVDSDLRRAKLIHADLRKANLQGSDLRGAYLLFANLRKADLRNAQLQGAFFGGADLVGARLDGANLTEADCETAVLEVVAGIGDHEQRSLG